MFIVSHEKYRIQISWPISYTIPHCLGGQSNLQHNTGIFKMKPALTCMHVVTASCHWWWYLQIQDHISLDYMYRCETAICC